MHALVSIGWTQHWGIQGSCDKYICAILYPLLEVTSLKKNMYICVKSSQNQVPKALVTGGQKRRCPPSQRPLCLMSSYEVPISYHMSILRNTPCHLTYVYSHSNRPHVKFQKDPFRFVKFQHQGPLCLFPLAKCHPFSYFTDHAYPQGSHNRHAVFLSF